MRILIKPIITEKSLRETNQGKYAFEVGLFASKTQIKRAIEHQFGVKVISTQTLINKGNTTKNSRNRTLRTRSDIKKAIVTLAKGQKIDLFDTGALSSSK